MCSGCDGRRARRGIECIVPPFMLRVLEMRGDAETAAMARKLLKRDGAMRALREGRARAEMVADDTLSPNPFVAARGLRAAAVAAPDRAVYDGQGKAALPGKLVRAEGGPATGDHDADAAYDGAGAVFELYAEGFGRDSLDGRGMKLVSTVDHRKNFNNAFWDGEQMVYGAGDGKIFRTFTELSIIGHEMSHGVVRFLGGLTYEGQAGALSESYADVFGALTVQRKVVQSAGEADWLIGKGMLAEGINGAALRSMKMPGTAYSDALLGQDPQPWHMDYYVATTDDNGGVHINSGIPNHAFYLYSMYLGGRAWEAPGQVWYQALQRLNNPMASFHDWAVQTVETAMDLFGIGSMQAVALRRAWKMVGMPV